MKTTRTLSVLVFLIVGMFGMGERVEAKSVTWTNANWDGFNALVCGGVCQTSGSLSVTYQADAYNASVGGILHDWASIPVGTVIHFYPKAFANTDIAWFFTGYGGDSPYGYWGAGGTSIPSAPGHVIPVHLFGIGGISFTNGTPFDRFLLTTFVDPNDTQYKEVRLVANPPTLSISPSTNLSCGVYNGTYFPCTVTGAGTVTASINYSDTYANSHLRLAFKYTTLKHSAIPAQSLPFYFTAFVPNSPPAAPTITPQPFSGLINTAYSFNFTATDPDANNIYYQIDWDYNGTIDANSGWVSSGTSQPSAFSWSTPGVKSFQARSVDSNGTVSGWTAANVTINLPAAPTVVTNPAVADTVYATGNPNGGVATGWFRYDTINPGTCNNTFGAGTGSTALGAGNAPVPFSQSLSTTPATTYYYCAIASNAGGTGYGTINSFLTAPGTPTGLTATPNASCSSGVINISWNATTGATSYDIERDGVYATVFGTTYSHGGLTNKSSHTYRIRANNTGGSSPWSAPDTETTAVACPNPDLIPLDFTATAPATGGTFFDGENIILNGTVKNTGSLATVSSFDDNFSYRFNSTGGWTDITPYTNHPAGLAINATAVDNATVIPSGSGTLNIQYCVDSNNDIDPEYDTPIGENNNCMVKNFTVHPKPTGSLTVTSPISYNTTSNIVWTTAGTSGCTPAVTGTNGDTWGGVSGSKSSSLLTSDTMYSLTCSPYPGILDSKMVDVNTDVFIQAKPRVVQPGQNATITWGTGMEINCAVTGNGTPRVSPTTGLGTITEPINVRTTYVIDCPLVDKSVTVEVQGYGSET